MFGYEDGAFTGSRKKGSIGKILQANGGTLFLDEIGDMPLGLQARLLRVLQERMVTPLGSTKSITVNVELICATNRNLRELIAKRRIPRRSVLPHERPGGKTTAATRSHRSRTCHRQDSCG